MVNSEDPDEMPHYVAFHLGLHCLSKWSFRSLYLVTQRVNLALFSYILEKNCFYIVLFT